MGLKYYAGLNDAPVTDLLRQAKLKTKNHLMDFSYSSWHYRACIGYLIYLLSTRVDLSFAVHKLAKLSANPGKYILKD